MALKWYELDDIVTRQATVTRSRAESAMSWLQSQEGARRRKREQAAAARNQRTSAQWLAVGRAKQCARASQELFEANKQLSQYGLAQIPVSQSTVRQQISSGHSWAQTYVGTAQAESYEARIDDARKKAEEWVRYDIRQLGENWADYSPDQKDTLISAKMRQILSQSSPEEFGVEEEVAPEATKEQGFWDKERWQPYPWDVDWGAFIRKVIGREDVGQEELGEPQLVGDTPEAMSVTWTIKAGDLGIPGGGYMIGGEWRGKPNVELVIKADPKSDDLLIYHNNRSIGTIDAETQEFTFDDPYYLYKAFVPTVFERMRLHTEGIYPTEAFDDIITRLWVGLTDWLNAPKQMDVTPQVSGKYTIEEGVMPEREIVTLPSPRTVLGIAGLIGSLAYMGHAGIQSLQLFLNTSARVGSAYVHLPRATLKGMPKPPTSVARTPAEIKMYKAYQQTAVYRDWVALLKQTGKEPSQRAFLDRELFRAFQLARYDNNPRAAQDILDHLREGFTISAAPVSRGRAVVPYTTPTAPPPISAKPPTPALAVPMPTGVTPSVPAMAPTTPTMITGEMQAALTGMGYTAIQIATMTSQQALSILYKPEVPTEGIQVPEKGITPEAVTLTVFRGERPLKKGVAYASDPGDFGAGKYYSSSQSFARAYGYGKEPVKTELTFNNPLRLSSKKAVELSTKYKTVTGTEQERVAGARQMREDLLAQGYDGLIVDGYEGGKGTLTVVDYRTAIPETTALAEGETITGIVPEGEVMVEGITMSPVEVRKTRQSIMATGKAKGLSQTSLNKIFKEVAGRTPDDRQLPYSLTEMTDEQLVDTLEIIKTARPVRIGTKIVIRPSTEKKIQSLKQSLIKEGKLSEEAFNDMVNQLKLPTTRYETAQGFITEKQGKSLIRTMNDEAEVGLIEWEAKVATNLEKNPAVKAVHEEHSKRIAKENEVYFQGKPADTSVLKDMRFAMQDLQIKTGKPFYDVYFRLNRAKNANHAYYADAQRRFISSTPEYNKLVNNMASMKRIRDYIASKNAWAKVKSPKDITPDEIKLANAYEKALLDLQPDFKYQRFLHQYHTNEGNVAKMQEHIPDAPPEELRAAVNIYEKQGASSLKAYLDTKTWGIIESGYEPHYVVSPQLAMRKLKAAFVTRRLEPRTGVEFYPEDITIDKAVSRYIRQVRSYNLQPYVRKLERLYADAIPQLKNPYKIRRGLSMMTSEMLGYKDRTFLGELVMKVASQAYIVVFGASLDLPFRNLFQNLAFAPKKQALIDPRNKVLTAWDKDFYNTHVSQMKATERDLLLGEEGGLPGLRRINRFILRVNIYGASDSKVNRIWLYWAHLNEGQRALTQYLKDGDISKFMKDSSMVELTLTQQKQVLENLMLEEVTIPGLAPTTGEHAAITEIATEIVNNTHFLYDRAQRAWIEMGESGRLIGSLVVFPRSVAQRLLIQAKVLDPKGYAPSSKKKKAFWVIFSMLWGSLAANYLYKEATGKTYPPYSPMNILQWSPGGLAIGSLELITDIAGLTMRAMAGDENALGQLPTAIERSGDTFVPFYKSAIRSLEVALEKKYIDRYTYRLIRAAIEKKLWEMGFLDKKGKDLYEPNASFYEAERSWEWKIKHALFGTEPSEEEVGEASIEETMEQLLKDYSE